MKAWEIWTGPVHGPAHPVLLISNQLRIDRKQYVVVLVGSTMRPSQPFKVDALQITLDQEDGLNWQTRFDCDLLFTLDKKDITHKRGEVSSLERRRAISQLGFSLSTGTGLANAELNPSRSFREEGLADILPDGDLTPFLTG